MQDKKTFGQYIRQKREAAGLSQRTLAEELHVVESAVSKWERGLSYPDVALIPDICQALSISEHEFFTACDDEKAAARDRAARRWANICRGWRLWSTVLTLATLGICLICDLAVFHTLDWFWIVMTSLGIWYSLTTLPLWLKKDRFFWSITGGTASLLLLLLSCWLYAGGTWLLMGSVITTVSLLLPWGLYALWRRRPAHPVLWAAGGFTLWLPLLLAIIWLFLGGDWLFTLALPIAGLCLLFLWAALGCLALPVGRWCKTGLLTLLCALTIPAGNALSDCLGGVSAVFSHFLSYFIPGMTVPAGETVNQLSMWLLLAAALVFFILTLGKRFSKKP